MQRFLRAAVAVLAVFGLTVAAAPSAVAADPVITLTVSGANPLTAVEFCPWNEAGSNYNCKSAVADNPSNNVQLSVPMTALTAATKYAVRVTRSGYWTLWWHQSGISPVIPTSTADGEYVSAGASSIALGTFTMKQIKYLTGTVTSTAGGLLNGIELGIYANPSAVTSGSPLTGTVATGDGTDPGQYEIAIPYSAPGTYTIGLKDPLGQYADSIESVSLSAVNTTRTFTLDLQDQTVTVGGTVALSGSSDASGVAVDAYVWTDQSTWAPAGGDAATESASDGSYQLQVGKGRTFTLRFSKSGYRTVWLGGTAPGEPTDTNSRVATGLTGIDLVTLSGWTSAFASVAGQDEDACNPTKGATTLATGGDFNQAVLDLGFTVSIWGKSGSKLVVTDRGIAYLSDSPLGASNFAAIPDLATWSGAPVFAPLWFDGDLSGLTADSVTYGSDGDTACIRWNDVGHYSADDSAPNTFQLIIESTATAPGRSSGDVDLTFNYDQVLWDASGQARVGYTAGDKVKGHYWANPSAVGSGLITDSGTSPLIAGSAGGTTPGRYRFEIHNALVASTAASISGTALVGTTLRVNPGTWSPTPDSLSYQWLLAGKQVSTSSSYKVPSKSEGKLVTLTVTAKRAGLSDVSSSVTTPVLRKFSKSSTPKIYGTVKVGSTLTAKAGSWSPKPSLRYQWYRGSTAISGATSSKYKVQLADVGTKLTVRVTGSRSGYLAITKGSKSTKTVPLATMSAATPKIVGTAKIGQTLSVVKGTWTAGASLSVRWYRSGKTIDGATGDSYLLQAADKGKTITVKVTGTLASYQTTSKTSKATSKVS